MAVQIVVTFACGHRQEYPVTEQAKPTCTVCGESRVNTVQAPAPVFHGFVTGPCARVN